MIPVTDNRVSRYSTAAAVGYLGRRPRGPGPQHQSLPRRYHTHAVADPLIWDGSRVASQNLPSESGGEMWLSAAGGRRSARALVIPFLPAAGRRVDGE